jgi:integrase
VPFEYLGATYRAAHAAKYPDLPDLSAEAWWQALLAVTFNTGLRRRTLFELRMEWVDWKGRALNIPPKSFKTGHGQMVHLNPTAMNHLLLIRGERELVFPWPHSDSLFNCQFHRLQAAAGIPESEFFGLHRLRKTLATCLWRQNPSAAQLGLGHTTMTTTQNHYVEGGGILADALDQLTQPDEFRRRA